jgi:hypothetical protein
MLTVTETDIRELDHRSNDGIDVRLLWSAQTDQVWIEVCDHRSGGSFRLEVERSEALGAFRHPYAYAAPREADRALAA